MNGLAFKVKKNYRAWPLFAVAFVRLFYTAIFERALSNYLLFNIEIKPSILGFITATGALTYIIAPLLGQMLTKKIGVRNALLLNAFVTPLLNGAQILFPEPWFLIMCRIGLGLAIGLFWPNCLYLLSQWQRVSSEDKSKKNFGYFNLSWNTGFIFGYLAGFGLSFFWDDYLTMIVAFFLSFLLIPFSFFIDKDSRSKEEIQYQTDDPVSHFDIEMDMKINSNMQMVIFPILYSWLSIWLFATSKSILVFGYPLLLKAFESPSYLTYIVQAGLQVTQLIGLTLINSMKPYNRKKASIMGAIGLILSTLTILLIRNMWFISIMLAIVGLFLGFIHGTSMKIMLDYGAAENTTKYSIINEILVGICFGVTPIIIGYIAEVNVYLNYTYIVVFGFCAIIIFLYISRNVKRN